METKKPYRIVFRFNGKIIGEIWGDYADDPAAEQAARHYFSSSPSDIAHIHRCAEWSFPFVAELKKIGRYNDIIKSREAA